ncbi:MAG: hypothetical protein ACKVE4_01060 [Dissulfuribacterales bacterium]
MAGSIKPALKGRALIDANSSDNSRRVKYFLLIAFIVAALLGMNYSGLMDPISFLF